MKKNFQPYQKRALEYKVAQDKLSEELRKGQREQKKIEEWKEDILAFKADLVAVAEKQKEAQKKVEEDKKKQDNQTAIEKDEKQKLIDKIDALAVKLRQEKENLRIKRDEWYESKRQARNKKIEEQNQERAEKRKENEHFEEEKILQRRQEKKQEIPLEYEITSCQNLISYLNELLSATKTADQKEEASKEPKKEEPKKEEVKKEEPKQGEEKGYIKGKEEPEDLLFPDLASKKKGPAKKKKKKTAAKIVHNWDTFARFEELKIGDPPVTPDQLPKAIEAVKAKLAELQKESAQKRADILKEIAKEEEAEKKS